MAHCKVASDHPRAPGACEDKEVLDRRCGLLLRQSVSGPLQNPEPLQHSSLSTGDIGIVRKPLHLSLGDVHNHSARRTTSRSKCEGLGVAPETATDAAGNCSKKCPDIYVVNRSAQTRVWELGLFRHVVTGLSPPARGCLPALEREVLNAWS